MIVPGSPHDGLNHPFSWYAIVRNRKTGKQRTYWMNGSECTREDIARHIAMHFPNVEVLTIDRCTKMPDKILQPVPPEDFQFGVLHAPDAESDPELARPRVPGASPIVSLPPLVNPLASRKPLSNPFSRSK